MKLGIGTVQFGLDYGISNSQGRCPESEVAKILRAAKAEQISVIDTAAVYGCSEEVLGRMLPDESFSIVTKISKSHALPLSLKRLRRNKIYAVLAHQADELLTEGGQKLWEDMLLAKANGQVEKIGASVYHPRQIEALLNRYSIDILQVPVSLLDQRLIRNGYLDQLKQNKIEIHARSVFLQGLLLLNPQELHSRFLSIQPLLKKLHRDCEQKEISILQSALGFVQTLTQIDKIIVGMTSYSEFLGLIKASTTPFCLDDFSEYAISDETILNPSLW